MDLICCLRSWAAKKMRRDLKFKIWNLEFESQRVRRGAPLDDWAYNANETYATLRLGAGLLS